ncbi:putative G-protein coupled receptor C02B8.5 [Toxocara canis]|uniref:Putative G-protein coupled receptor C02B8.5 n=1 Tax=Toxocara canis TaxID=6265 RepID=A0A0B2VY01_TOXCA|nr:putative G-protein coupled receptor C02B8.5 [Toxocara canis]
MESSELLSGWLIIISIQTHYVTTNHINMSTSDFYLIRTSEPFHFTSSINFTSPLFDSNGRHKRQLAFLPFGDLLKQRTEGNNVAQCPCVINPGSNRCIPYDSRYQAASIEEAIVSFPDVSMDPRILEQTSGTPHDGNAFACKTLECQTCAALLSERLRNVGLLSSGDFLGVPLPQFVQPQLCRRFRFTRSLPCPCVINPGSNRCIPYDSRYQAASIEEAIVSFPDVSMDPRILEQTSGTPHDGNAFACKTLECQTCAALLSERLRNVGLLSSGDFLGVPLPQFVQPQLCRRFRFTRSLPSPQPPSVTPNFVKEAIEEGLRKLFPTNLFAPNQTPQLALPTLNSAPNLFAQTSKRKFYAFLQVPRNRAFGRTTSQVRHSAEERREDRMNAPQVIDGKGIKGQPLHTRVSRQSTSFSSHHRLLGRTYTISCVERGEAENDDTELLNLCGACWTWRQLPESYFPRLVNELVCKDTPEDYCLSGWGSCNQRYRNIDVLQRVGDSWKPAVISLAAFCDCKVKAGSEIHALVVGKKK